jgi:hypothetical protein
MRRAPALALPLALSLLAACATAPKLPALPPPVPAPTGAAAAQPAATRWYQPYATDSVSVRERGGMGLLYAKYAFTDDALTFKTDVDYSPGGPTLTLAPMKANLPAIYANAQVGFYGLSYGALTLDVKGPGGPGRIDANVIGLYEGIRVPITLLDFKGPDIQLLLIPGITLQVFAVVGGNPAGWETFSLMAGGSLNGAGLGIAVADWLVVEADFWKWGWTYAELDFTAPDGTSVAGSVKDFNHGFAPVLFARVLF